MLRAVALPAVLLAVAPFHSSIEPLPRPVKTQLKERGFWHAGCPVPLSGLRLLTVSHWDFDGRTRTGQLVVNEPPRVRSRACSASSTSCASRSATCASTTRTGRAGRPRDGDVSGSFECRQAVPSPCTGGSGTGTWSMHAYGLAVDLNPRREPVRRLRPDPRPAARRYRDRSRTGRAWSRRRCRGVPLDRLGLGRRLGRQHEGLHALLVDRALSPARLLRVARGGLAALAACSLLLLRRAALARAALAAGAGAGLLAPAARRPLGVGDRRRAALLIPFLRRPSYCLSSFTLGP